jgi:hypothetical protein
VTGKRLEDLVNVESEHLVGFATNAPLVKMRAESDGTVMVGQMSPEQARDIAMNLLECAARAEYEYDLLIEMQRLEFEDQAIAGIFGMVRAGEFRRHTGDD